MWVNVHNGSTICLLIYHKHRTTTTVAGIDAIRNIVCHSALVGVDVLQSSHRWAYNSAALLRYIIGCSIIFCKFHTWLHLNENRSVDRSWLTTMTSLTKIKDEEQPTELLQLAGCNIVTMTFYRSSVYFSPIDTALLLRNQQQYLKTRKLYLSQSIDRPTGCTTKLILMKATQQWRIQQRRTTTPYVKK